MNSTYNYSGINVIAGSEFNNILSGVVAATLMGGINNRPNSVTGDFGTVCGGVGCSASHSSTAGGGEGNVASGFFSTVTGGVANTASGTNAMVASGRNNVAQGQFSFASGYRAKANHDGTFIWSDFTETDFPSTAANQFLIRANGGVGINTNNPAGSALSVAGIVESKVGGFKFPDGTILTSPGGILAVGGFLRSTVDVPGTATVNIPKGYSLIGVTGTGGGTLVLPKASIVANGTSIVLNLEQPVGGSGVITIITQGSDTMPNIPVGSQPALILNVIQPALRFYTDGASHWYQW